MNIESIKLIDENLDHVEAEKLKTVIVDNNLQYAINTLFDNILGEFDILNNERKDDINDILDQLSEVKDNIKNLKED